MLCNIYVMVVIHNVTVMVFDTRKNVMYILCFVKFKPSATLTFWDHLHCAMQHDMNDAVFCDVYVWSATLYSCTIPCYPRR
jgi:hypothetical protein